VNGHAFAERVVAADRQRAHVLGHVGVLGRPPIVARSKIWLSEPKQAPSLMTAKLAIVVRSPIVTFGSMIAKAPISTSLPITALNEQRQRVYGHG